MLTRESILRQIEAENVDYIQVPVAVEYDERLRMPLSFIFANRTLEVLELLGSYHEWTNDPSVLYLVRTRQEVFALYRDLDPSLEPPWSGRWVLYLHVHKAEEQAVLTDMRLKRAADFHGHLCPDLVIGYRACLCAQNHLALALSLAPELRIRAENRSSAVDAIQQMTGCTLGNGRLVACDYGKHAYTFVAGTGRGVRLTLTPEALPSPEFLIIEARLSSKRITLQDTASYQAALDAHIVTLLGLDEAVLFGIEPVTVDFDAWPARPTSSALAACTRCGELTAVPELVACGGQLLCRPCAGRGAPTSPADGPGLAPA